MRKFILLGCLFCYQCTVTQQPIQPSQPTDTAVDLEALTPQLMTVPNAVDSNQDGVLSTREVLEAPMQLAKLDKNGDGTIDWKEMGAWEKQLPLVRAHNVTKLIDIDGDISISAAEIKQATESLKQLDTNGDWTISKKEERVGKSVDKPFFTMGVMTPAVWEQFRSYSKTLDGPIPPGKDERVFKGYTFIHDAGDGYLQQRSDETFLLDENGKKVHNWKHNGYSPEASVAYLLPNGQLLRTYSKHNWSVDKTLFPVGATSTIELVDWEGNVLWDFTMSVAKKYSFHHDVEYLPNGNILAIRYNAFNLEEARAMGWDQSLSDIAVYGRSEEGLLWMSNILELQPNLEDGSTEIVWQWNSWDHLVQNKYPNKLNYGDSTDPSKIHINYLNLDKDIPYNKGQLFHLNTVEYHPELDLIMLCSPTYGEVWIIDHSTTWKEATGSKGGKYDKGGDLIYRWGNDEAFGKDSRDNSFLYWQHDAQWIEEGLPGTGNILIYNNGQRRTVDGKYIPTLKGPGFNKSYSNVLEVKLPMDDQGQFNRNQKAEVVWSWANPDKTAYYSPFMSGAQRLPNGNTIFCSAYNKHIAEVTSTGEKVLDYRLEGWGRLYRVYKFGEDYSGLKF